MVIVGIDMKIYGFQDIAPLKINASSLKCFGSTIITGAYTEAPQSGAKKC